ncbi:hypothetical protein ACXR2T_15375 [Leucobacter sp. HY1910]
MAKDRSPRKRSVQVLIRALLVTVFVAVILFTSGTIGLDVREMPPRLYLAAGLGRLFLTLASIMLGLGALLMIRKFKKVNDES